MDGSWLGLIELCVVFGGVGFFCWRELASHRRWKASRDDSTPDDAPADDER